jgi:hypothetical protein
VHPRLARLITSTRWPTICGVLIVIGVTVRIGAAFVLMPAEPELNEYGVIAQNLVDGRGYSYFASSGDVVQPGSSGTPIPGSFMGPGYTYTVALARWIGDGSSARFRLALGALNLALSLALLSLVYAAGRQLAGHRAGLTAGALAAVYPQLALVPSLGSAANFYLPATVVVAIGAVALRKQRTGLGIGLLVAGGLWLWTARAEAPLFVIAAVAAAAIGSAAWRRVVGLGLAALAVTAVAMSLLWLLPRTREMDRQLVSATTTGAYNFWLGNASGASGSQKRPPPQLAALEEQASHLPATPDY